MMVEVAERFRKVAEANFFEVDVAETIRAHPIGIRHRVLLEVQPLTGDTEKFKLLQHRQPKWTALYQNRTVSAAWIENFLQANRGVAWFIAETEAIAKRSETEPTAQIDYGKSRSDEPEDQRPFVEARLNREKSVLEANARIAAALVAAGLDGVDPRSRTLAYYDAFLRNNGGGRHVRGRGGPTRK